MKKTFLRALTLILALCLMLPLVACGDPEVPPSEEPPVPEQVVTFDESLTIIYAQSDGEYAKSAALLLREALRPVLGYRPETVTDRAFRGDVAANRVLLIGGVTLLDKSDEVLENGFTVALLENGAWLRAEDSLTLYMAAKMFAKQWPTEAYGLKDGVLTLSNTMCKSLQAKDIGANTMISVMSQNIRCANDAGGNYISDRKGRFKQLMEAYQPDLLGTQETTAEWNRIFDEYFGGEYGMVGCSRDGKNATSGEWNTILYKKSRFELVESGNIWLTSTPNTPSFTEGALCRRICTWAIFTDKLTGEDIFFANTHLDHSNDTVRGEQAAYLMEFLSDYVDEYPMYLTGDFNTGNKNTPYKTITNQLNDAHKTAEVDASTVDGTFHNYGSMSPTEIDFCFHNDMSQAVAYRVLSEKYNGYVSDHYGLIAYFTVK